MKLFDSHCHLQDDRLRSDLPGIINRADQAGVARMVCNGSAETDWPQVVELSQDYPGAVIPALGLHPWYVRERSPAWLNHLTKLLESSSAVVGEIGLDHALDERNDAEQEEVFLAQLDLSRQLGRPACLHCRKAWGRLLELLTPLGRHPTSMMIHSFSGAPDLIPTLTSLNVYFSFSGSLTIPNNRRSREALKAVPEDRLLIETDSPDIPPHPDDVTPAPMCPNEPANLPIVLREAARIRGMAVEALADRLWQNSCTFFGVQ
jgi:TatD DNase family protein